MTTIKKVNLSDYEKQINLNDNKIQWSTKSRNIIDNIGDMLFQGSTPAQQDTINALITEKEISGSPKVNYDGSGNAIVDDTHLDKDGYKKGKIYTINKEGIVVYKETFNEQYFPEEDNATCIQTSYNSETGLPEEQIAYYPKKTVITKYDQDGYKTKETYKDSGNNTYMEIFYRHKNDTKKLEKVEYLKDGTSKDIIYDEYENEKEIIYRSPEGYNISKQEYEQKKEEYE